MAVGSSWQRCVGAVLPKGFFPRLYILAVLVLSAAFIIAESYILHLTKQSHREALASQWRVPGIQQAVSTSMDTYVMYNVLFILAQVYVIFLCMEALAHKDIVQAIVVVVFYFVCLAFSVTRHVSFYVYPSVAARLFTRNSNMYLMQATVVASYVLALASLTVLSNKLRKEVGWNVFKRLGADMGLHRAYMWRQGLMMLLRVDIYFIGSFLVQMSALVLKVDAPETWLQVTVFIPFCVVIVVGGFYALHGEHRRLMMCISTCLFLSIGYFIFKIYRVCRPEILNKPEDPYADSRPFFMITVVVCMLLVMATCVASIMCIRNFDAGLKEAIAYDRMRARHMRMYAADKEASDELAQLVPDPDTTTRGRFTLD